MLNNLSVIRFFKKALKWPLFDSELTGKWLMREGERYASISGLFLTPVSPKHPICWGAYGIILK